VVIGAVTPREAAGAIDLDVMLFLFGVFVIGRAAEMSGELQRLAYVLFRHARSADHVVLLVLFGLGGASALLMNDTLAIVGTPVVIALARAHGMPERVLLLALAFAVTIGSVPSPIGNPQNLLVGVSDEIANPFATFADGLLVPTFVNLGATYGLLRLTERDAFHGRVLTHEPVTVIDAELARVVRVALVVFGGLIAARLALVALEVGPELRLTAIALVPAGLALAASPRRVEVVRGIDWPTLAFFAGLFVLVEGVARAGIAQQAFDRLGDGVSRPSVVLWAGAALSQVVSNVPFVALALPVLQEAHPSTEVLLALAAGSTVAGNFTILGAASNVIIVENAERRFGVSISFWAFMRLGAPLAVLNLVVYQAYFALI